MKNISCLYSVFVSHGDRGKLKDRSSMVKTQCAGASILLRVSIRLTCVVASWERKAAAHRAQAQSSLLWVSSAGAEATDVLLIKRTAWRKSETRLKWRQRCWMWRKHTLLLILINLINVEQSNGILFRYRRIKMEELYRGGAAQMLSITEMLFFNSGRI